MQDYKGFYKAAFKLFDGRVYKDYLRRFCYGVEASCYSYVPKLVLMLKSESEIIKAFELSRKFNTPLCFRGAGTSLSGQSSCDTVLVCLDFCWDHMKVNSDASSITLGCGVIGENANKALKPLGKKIGPDPATIAAAQIGGIVNNNSSGMCCGVKQNSYNTLKSIRVILGDGTILDSSDALSIASFKISHKELIDKVLNLRSEIINDKELCELIKRKYKIKNTTGYSINALLDYSDPIDIITHLFIGSEGTLGFVSSVELECVDDEKYKACALLFYDDILKAAKVVEILAKFEDEISSAEIMDYGSLKAASKFKGVDQILPDINEGEVCILIQSQNNNEEILKEQVDKIKNAIKDYPTSHKAKFSFDESEFANWWKIRKGIFPIAASAKRPGSSVITEDICFEIKDLGEGIKKLQELFDKHGFKDSAIIFGHALAGNLHFIITPNLSQNVEFQNFSNLVKDMSIMVSNFGGSIKAEHGTGRMVAPFVELEWGAKAYAINKKIKEIFDPHTLINPDVIISDDKDIFKKNIKQSALIGNEFDECVECGFCEKNCPSNKLTLSPRQRIALKREMQRLGSLNDKASKKLLKELKDGAKYFLNESCAACSMCEELCPVGINTANLALNERKANASDFSKKTAELAKANFSLALNGAKFALSAANLLNSNSIRKLSFKANLAIKTPVLKEYLPRKNSYKLRDKNYGFDESVVYFSSCLNRAFAPNKNLNDKRPIQEVFESLCKKAKINVIYPEQIDDICCGKIFTNYPDTKELNRAKNIDILKEATDDGKYPVVIDHGACSYELIKSLKDRFEIYDLSEYLLKFISTRLSIVPINDAIGLYTMCASKKLGLEDTMMSLAKLCTKGQVIVHSDTACCGFAGYKGFFTPQLNIHATTKFKRFYKNSAINIGFSNSSTCEIGLSEASSFSWQHIAYLLDSVSISQK